MTSKAETLIKEHIVGCVRHKDKNFGNARFVRNLVEKVLTQQANRLAALKTIDDEALISIVEEDVAIDYETERYQYFQDSMLGGYR